jgi:hypothetical protein
MASLRSAVLDGRFATYVGLTGPQEKFDLLLGRETRRILQSSGVTLVNATGVGRELFDAYQTSSEQERRELTDYRQVPCPKPPFHEMWLEALRPDGGRAGALVESLEAKTADELEEAIRLLVMGGKIAEETRQLIRANRPRTLVRVWCWHELQGHAGFGGEFVYWLDLDGSFLGVSYSFWPPSTDPREQAVIHHNLRSYQLWVLHTFMRLNCHNVVLVPRPDSAPRRCRHRHAPPSSTWHEILVKSVSGLRQAAIEPAPAGEKVGLRFHKVRGHLADYTKGKGLFGKWKIRIWVEGHTAGNPDLGTVASTYRVEG